MVLWPRFHSPARDIHNEKDWLYLFLLCAKRPFITHKSFNRLNAYQEVSPQKVLDSTESGVPSWTDFNNLESSVREKACLLS